MNLDHLDNIRESLRDLYDTINGFVAKTGVNSELELACLLLNHRAKFPSMNDLTDFQVQKQAEGMWNEYCALSKLFETDEDD